MNTNKHLHEIISEDLRKKILNKHYQIDQMIPKEIDLAVEYNVSRPTIRQAIQTLVDEGYLERIKGTGTFVRKKKISQDFIHRLKSYEDQMKSSGNTTNTKVINFTIEKANEEISEKLNINVGEPVYSLTRLRYANNEPSVFVVTYIPKFLYPDLLKIDFSENSLYSTFEKYNKPINSVRRELNAIKADHMTSVMLNIPIGDPIFYFKTIGYAEDSSAIEYSISWYRGDYNSFEVTINM